MNVSGSGEETVTRLLPSTEESAGFPAIPGYEVLREIGRGGMGVVYQARHLGLKRVVALKMSKARELADDERRRFRTEAEAVARLQHPHIVQIHDIGEHGGLPYLALEFVEGGSLAERLDGTPLQPAAAAQLVATLARAVHVAHEHDIVHRDLKPGNILLAGVGGQGSGVREEGTGLAQPRTAIGSSSQNPGPQHPTLDPKITDFGLAKKLDDSAGPTVTGTIVGTPSYMAPEQAEGKGRLVGPAADIYSLGAILYELLTGRPPFKAATPLDTLMQVVSADPVPPRQLQPHTPRDLETVCLKCLRKEPGRRYDTALALAEDLERFLAGQPVLARPVGWVERAWRFSRRHPGGAALVVLLGVASVALAATAAVLSGKIAELAEANRRERQAADLARRTIEDMTSEEALRFLETQKELRPEQRRFLEQAVAYYREALGVRASGRTERERQAGAFFRMAMLQKRLGIHAEAVESFRAALREQEPLAAEAPREPRYRQELARSRNELAILLKNLGRRGEAEAEYRAALKLREELVAGHPAVPEYRRDLARSRYNLSNLLADLGRRPEAEAEYRAALKEQESLAAENVGEPLYLRDLAQSHNALGMLLRALGQRDRAEAEYRTALGIQERLTGAHPLVPEYREDLAYSHNNLGNLLTVEDRIPEAEAEYRAALKELERLVAKQPQVPTYRQDLATFHTNLGEMLARMGRRSEAEREYHASLREVERLAADYPEVVAYAVDLADTCRAVGSLVRDGGQPAAALDWYARAITQLEGVLRGAGADSTARQFLRESRLGRAVALAQLGRHAEALAEVEPLLQSEPADAGPDEGEFFYDASRVFARAAAQDADKAGTERQARRAVALLRLAGEKGYQDAERVRRDHDLDALRGRADFQKLLEEMRQKK